MTMVAPARGAGVADTATPAAPARLAAVMAVLVVLVGAALGTTDGLGVLLGPQAVAVSAGVVERETADGWVVVPPGTRVADGAVLRAPDGIATLRVPGGSVDLAEGTQLTTGGTTLQVAAGTVVVQSPRVTVEAGGVTVEGPGAWRWDATGRIGSYAGAVVVTDATGRQTLVRALEQGWVRDAVVAESPRPYVYTGTDPFDRQHLSVALGVDDYVGALRRGLAADYGTAAQSSAFYTDFEGLDASLVSALGDVGFDRDGDRIGPPADVLVAAVVTDALVVNAGLAPQAAADEVRTLRLAGATWGLVAQARELDAGDVRAAAERALVRRQLAEQRGTAAPVVPTPAGPAGGGPDGQDPGGDDDPDPDPGPDPEPPPPPPPPPPEPGLLGSIVDETGLGDLVEGDLGDLVDDLVDTADDVLDGPDEATEPRVGVDIRTDADGDGDADVDGDGDGGLLDLTGEVVRDTSRSLAGAVEPLLAA